VLRTRLLVIPMRPPLIGCGRLLFALGTTLPLGLLPSSGRAQTRAPSPQTPREIHAFQPGVGIDWAGPAVHVDGQIVLRAGLVEFLACLPGKEHESIVRLDASATHVYMALGLIGLEAGHPPRWDDQRGRFGPPTGDLVDVSIEWPVNGRICTAAGFQWLRGGEYAQPPVDRPWVFAGSRRLGDGTLSADRGGEGIAVVDQPNSLLALSRNHVSRNAELWAEANTDAIPPTGTAVQVVLRPAKTREYDARVDFRGAAFVDGRFVHPEDLADLIKLARRLSPDYVQPIHIDGTLQSDLAILRKRLLAADVSPNAFRFIPPGTPDNPLRPPGSGVGHPQSRAFRPAGGRTGHRPPMRVLPPGRATPETPLIQASPGGGESDL
jgi:hypothetical protein